MNIWDAVAYGIGFPCERQNGNGHVTLHMTTQKSFQICHYWSCTLPYSFYNEGDSRQMNKEHYLKYKLQIDLIYV